ncbi:lysozyme-like domain-containing protein [Chytriomyces cf. hyalinus JEL632]|nr:lysozyme-like domain-containing protein [Chytriomyces cf. hyalinus JEL632]
MATTEFCYGVYQGPGASPPTVPDLSWSNAGPLSFPSNLDGGYGTPLTQLQAYGIMSLVWVAENSEGDLDGVVPWYKAYSYIQNIGDGRGFTTNIVGFCSGTGDLLVFLQNLQKISPCHPLTKYIPDVQLLFNGDLTGLEGLPQLVLDYGGGPNGDGPIDPAYVEATWTTLTNSGDGGYWGAAMDYSRKYYLSLPISKGQLYDIALNSGISGLDTVIGRVGTPPPTPETSGQDAEVNWLLSLQSEWLNYIAENPSIDDGQLDRGLMWQHLVDPSKTQKNGRGQVGANNNVPILDLAFPFSVNCYGSTFNIRAPEGSPRPSATPTMPATSKITTTRTTVFQTPAISTATIPSATASKTAPFPATTVKSTVSSRSRRSKSSSRTKTSTKTSTKAATFSLAVSEPSSSRIQATSTKVGASVSNGAACTKFGQWACNNLCICNYTDTPDGFALVWYCSEKDAFCSV